MIIMPDERILKYISTDEEGNWIHSPEMPEELLEVFEEFVRESREIEQKMHTGLTE